MNGPHSLLCPMRPLASTSQGCSGNGPVEQTGGPGPEAVHTSLSIFKSTSDRPLSPGKLKSPRKARPGQNCLIFLPETHS